MRIVVCVLGSAGLGWSKMFDFGKILNILDPQEHGMSRSARVRRSVQFSGW
jgi:hypothetical protein